MMIIQDINASGIVSQPSRRFPKASFAAVPNIAGGSSSSANFHSAIVESVVGAVGWNNYQISLELGASVENLSPAVASLSVDGLLERVSDGMAVIRSTGSDYSSTLRLSMVSSGGKTSTNFLGWVEGSASDLVSSEVTALWVEGKVTPIFSTKDDASGIYATEADCWIGNTNLSGLAVALSLNGGTSWSQAGAPVAITPRHALGVRHWGFSYGSAIARFRGNDGTIHERSIIGVSDQPYGGEDLLVLALAAPDLPESVTPFSVVGEWFREDFSQVSGNLWQCWTGAYGFAVNQNYHAVGMLFGQGSNLSRTFRFPETDLGDVYQYIEIHGGRIALALTSGNLDAYSDFFTDIIIGDSGKPTFVMVDGEPKLVSLFTTSSGGPFVGASDGLWTNAMITSADSNAGISTGYTVTIAPDPTP